MPPTVDQYLHAATRENTRRSYRSAIEHFEAHWGGYLPATADSVARYLADHAESLALNTLRQRLAALAKWHGEQGFPDPTKAPVVKAVLKGISELHPPSEKRAKPLQLEQLAALVQWLDQQLIQANEADDRTALLTHFRNKALILIGFWRGFRSDELTRLQIEHIQVSPGEGMEIFLPRSKGDRDNRGRRFKAPALSHLCPVTAYLDWIGHAGLTEGPVFRGINQWGHIADRALHTDSIIALLRQVFRQAGLPEPDSYSGHSLRRGFASWANSNQWDVKTLMEYVGWKDVQSAMRYIDGTDPFAQQRIEQRLPVNTLSAPPATETVLHVDLRIQRYHKRVRGMKKTRAAIEQFCLKPYRMKVLSKDRQQYQITVPHETPEQLDELLDNLLHEMHDLANNNRCIAETTIKDPESGRVWD